MEGNFKNKYDLSRFVVAHKMDFEKAYSEIANGRKTSHWMWYIFPQLKELGKRDTARFYGIKSYGEAKAFLEDEYLGGNLIKISKVLLTLDNNDPVYVFDGKTDAIKLRSSMTLFAIVAGENSVFEEVLKKYFGGKYDGATLGILRKKAGS